MSGSSLDCISLSFKVYVFVRMLLVFCGIRSVKTEMSTTKQSIPLFYIRVKLLIKHAWFVGLVTQQNVHEESKV